MAWKREMNTPPKLHSEYCSIFTFYYTVNAGAFHKSIETKVLSGGFRGDRGGGRLSLTGPIYA